MGRLANQGRHAVPHVEVSLAGTSQQFLSILAPLLSNQLSLWKFDRTVLLLFRGFNEASHAVELTHVLPFA